MTGRPPPALVLLAGLLVLGGVVVAGGTGVPVDTDGEAAPARPSASEQVVRSFATAMQHGDRDALSELLDPDAGPIALPGIPLSLAGNDALALFAAVMELDVTTCEDDGSSLSGSSVTCGSVIDSQFAQAGNVDGRVIPVTYQVADDRIVAIERDPSGAPELADYCYWAEREIPDARLFDAGCRPVPNAGLAAAHARHGADFVVSGRPRSGAAYRNSRIEVSLLRYRIEEFQDFSRAAAGFAESAATARGVPGVVGYGPSPSISDLFQWSSVVYRVAPGTCFVDGSEAPDVFTLECPRSSWSGPLLDLLGLGDVEQSFVATIRDGVVTELAGATHRGLFSSFVRSCQAATARDPAAAATVYEDGCRPIYTVDAANRLLALLGDGSA